MAWVGGLFDGEGTICMITLKTKHPYLLAAIGMTHRPTIDRVRSLCGGVYYSHCRKRMAQESRMFYLKWNGMRAVEFLTRIRPYLFTKSAEADIAIRYADLIGPHGGRGGKLDSVLLQGRIEMADRLRAAKRLHSELE